MAKGQTMIYKLHRKRKIEQHGTGGTQVLRKGQQFMLH
jgi:hypothetical protein